MYLGWHNVLRFAILGGLTTIGKHVRQWTCTSSPCRSKTEPPGYLQAFAVPTSMPGPSAKLSKLYRISIGYISIYKWMHLCGLSSSFSSALTNAHLEPLISIAQEWPSGAVSTS